MASPAKKAAEADFPLKLTIERASLLNALARLQSIVEKRNTIPILSNIKLDAGGDGLELTATDMDLVAIETVPAQIEGGGKLTVPAATLYDIVRKLPEGSQIFFDTDQKKSQLIVNSGNSRFALSYLSADEFPVMSSGDMTNNFSMTAPDFLSLIGKARFAMSLEETRYYLNGVYLHIPESSDAEGNKSKDPLLRSVATDGHRLARIETALPQGADNMPGIIIPRKTVNEIGRLFNEQSGNIEISLSETKIKFGAGNLVLLSKLVDGTFPDYDRVIPSNNDKIMEVDTKLLTQAVDRVATISTEKTRGVKFSLFSGKLAISAQSPESGSANEELEVKYSAYDMEIGFNSRYLLEMMGQIEGDTVQFAFNDPSSPALVRDPSDVSSLYVIMPMRV